MSAADKSPLANPAIKGFVRNKFGFEDFNLALGTALCRIEIQFEKGLRKLYHYIRFGADTPSKESPFPKVCPVAASSNSLALRRLGSSTKTRSLL